MLNYRSNNNYHRIEIIDKMEECLSKSNNLDDMYFLDFLKNTLKEFFDFFPKKYKSENIRDIQFIQNRIEKILVGHNSIFDLIYFQNLNFNLYLDISELPKTMAEVIMNQKPNIKNEKIPFSVKEYFGIKIFNLIRESLKNIYWKNFGDNLGFHFLGKLLKVPSFLFLRITKIFEHFFIYELDLISSTKTYNRNREYSFFLNENYLNLINNYISIFLDFTKNRSYEGGRNNFTVINASQDNINIIGDFITNYFNFYLQRPNIEITPILVLYQNYQNSSLVTSTILNRPPVSKLQNVFFCFLEFNQEMNELENKDNLKIFENVIGEFTKNYPDLKDENQNLNLKFREILCEIITKIFYNTNNKEISDILNHIARNYHINIEEIKKSIPSTTTSRKLKKKYKQKYFLDWNSPYDYEKENMFYFFIFYYISRFIDFLWKKENYNFFLNSEKIYRYGKLVPYKNPLLMDYKIPVTNLRIFARKPILLYIVLILVVCYIYSLIESPL